MAITVNWSNPLLSGALDVIHAGSGTLTSYGTPVTTALPNGLNALGSGTTGTASGYKLDYAPAFATHSGDMTITMLAMSDSATNYGFIGGYNHSSGSNYGNLLLTMNKRGDYGSNQRGCFGFSYTPARSGFASAVSFGTNYVSDTTNYPFYTVGQPAAVSVAFLGASTTDKSVVVNGAVSGLTYVRSNAVAASTMAAPYTGFGMGGCFKPIDNTIQSAGAGSIAVIIIHGRKLTQQEQIDLTYQLKNTPEALFNGLSGGTVDGTATGATLTGTATLTPGGASAPITGSFTIPEALENNAGSLWLNQPVAWTWTPAGRVGSMAGKTPVDGSGTTHATTGLLTIPGLPLGAGQCDIAVLGATSADDAVYRTYGTVV